MNGKIDWTNITIDDVWLALRRRFYLKFRKKYVEESIKARRGECGYCPSFCCSLNGCKHYNIESFKCKIYKKRPKDMICITTPFDEKDIHKRLYYYCSKRYYWVDKRFAKTLFKAE